MAIGTFLKFALGGRQRLRGELIKWLLLTIGRYMSLRKWDFSIIGCVGAKLIEGSWVTEREFCVEGELAESAVVTRYAMTCDRQRQHRWL